MRLRGTSAGLLFVAGLLQLYVAVAGDGLDPDLRHIALLALAAAWFLFAGVTFMRYRHG